MSLEQITSKEELYEYLDVAMQLEHATIPPYLLALYTIHPGTNPDASHIIRTVVVEEMLHLTLAANILNAVGGKPDLTTPHFVPTYPTFLPDGETDFEVDLQAFSPAAIETFLKIERPRQAPNEESRIVRRPGNKSFISRRLGDESLHFYSIGEFYEEIARGIKFLCERDGEENLFTGNPALQVTPEYYYSGGGELHVVTDYESAKAATDLISGQGEGLGGDIYDKEHELAHYYRFDQLRLAQYYQPGDTPGNPSGPPLNVIWEASYPVQKNPRIAEYSDPDIHRAALAFNQSYADFLHTLTRAYSGQPQLLLDAVPQMFRLRDKMNQLIRVPLPDKPGTNAAPTFEVNELSREI